jgi:type IV secretion system protein VirD4
VNPPAAAPSADDTGDRAHRWLRSAMAALAILAAASATVSWDAQYVLVRQVKHATAIAALEAGIPDIGALIFATLGVALALHAKRAIRARALNLACVGISLAMNALASAAGWRDMAIWIMPSAVYALASDTLIGVVRAWVIARAQHTGQTLAEVEATPIAVLGGLLLWLLRLALAPPSTIAGFRTWVLDECPIAPGRKAIRATKPVRPPLTSRSHGMPASPTGHARQPGKQARMIALATDRHDLNTLPLKQVSRIANTIAAEVDLSPGTAPPRPARPRPRPPERPPPAQRHQPAGEPAMKTVIILIALAAAVLIVVKWAFLPTIPYRRLPRHCVCYLRLRLHLRLHPGPGHATLGELWLRWGRLAAFRRSRQARPSLAFWPRVFSPPTAYSIVVGRAHYRHAVRLPIEEHAVVTSPPRGGKTGWLASVILRYPGPVLSTTTKHDMFELTSDVRALRGPVHVFNPQGVGHVASTFRWNPLEGCQDPATAIRRADSFAQSVSQRGVEDASFWSAKASDYLRAYFHAAALAGLDLRDVARWVADTAPTQAEDILNRYPGTGRQWAAQLAELRGEANKTAQTIRMTMSRTLAFLADPALAASVLPADGQSLDLELFLQQAGTLYLIAESRGEDAPVAPLFACLASEIHYTAALLGSRMPGGRLDPPLLMALDEVTQICPVPVPSWLADSGGKGIQIITVAHGEAQLRARWGHDGARVIMDTSGAKIWLPGISDPATLQTASTQCIPGVWPAAGDVRRQHDPLHPTGPLSGEDGYLAGQRPGGGQGDRPGG